MPTARQIAAYLHDHEQRMHDAISLAFTEAIRLQAQDPLAFVGDRLKALSEEAAASAAGWSRPLGIIHKSTFAVRDPEESAAFCERYLSATQIEVPDPDLVARGIRWVRLPGGSPGCPPAEFHFVPWSNDRDTGRRGGIDLDGDGIVSADEMVDLNQQFVASLIDAADQDMSVWSVYANTHIAFCVAELTSIVSRLLADGRRRSACTKWPRLGSAATRPFFGPTRRADGVYQLYVELPYLHYVEIDSLAYDAEATGRPARDWASVARHNQLRADARDEGAPC